MIRFGKRFLGLLIAAALFLGAVPFNGFAVEPEVPTEEEVQGGCGVMLESREGLENSAALLSVGQVFGATLLTGEDMYTQLSTRQQACYNALAAISIDQILEAATVKSGELTFHRVRTQISGINGLSVSGSFTVGGFRPDASSASTVSGIYTDLCAAIMALRYDRPDILWINYLQYGYWVTQTGSACQVTDVVFDFYLEYEGREKEMQAQMMENAESIAAQAGTATDTYSRVLAIHDLLAAGNTYGDTGNDTAHCAYSALIFEDEYEPVCDGYAKAFKIVCDLMDIPCVTPSSTTHMWNNVKMDDGDWYNIDLTWDDSDDEALSYDYFLVGSQTVISGQAFSAQRDHVEENPYEAYRVLDTSGQLQKLTFLFPKKNRDSYEYLGSDYTPLTFPDVKRSAWYYEFVEEAFQMGLFSGDSDGYFLPDKNISRAEFASVMALSMGVDVSQYSGSSFTDVKATAWYAPVVAWVKEAGLMAGDGTKFRPSDPISRQEMCVVLSNALQTHVEPSAQVFTDDASIASWAKDAVYECYALGLMAGTGDGKFTPQGNTQRSQAAVVFTRFASLDAGQQ